MTASTAAVLARTKVKPPELRETSFDDYDQIADLETTVGLTPWPRENWLRLWLDNPAYSSVSHWPIGWVLQDYDGRIVGSIGNIPVLYYLGGRQFLGATLVGWAVDPKYRAYSLMLVAHRLQHPDVDFQSVTTAGPMTNPVFVRMGWNRVPVGQWDRMAYWVTNYGGAVESYMEGRAPKLISKLAGSVLHPPLRLIEGLRTWRRHRQSEFKLEWRSKFEPEFDDFWSELLAANPSLFLPSRTADSLSWHFRHALERNDAWILAARTGTRLVGYAILQRQGSRTDGFTKMMLVDFQTIGRDAKLSSAMFSCALDRCRSERIHMLGNLGCWMETAHPAVGRPSMHRALNSWCYLYKAINPELASVLQAPSSWYPTTYDGDASL